MYKPYKAMYKPYKAIQYDRKIYTHVCPTVSGVEYFDSKVPYGEAARLSEAKGCTAAPGPTWVPTRTGPTWVFTYMCIFKSF